MKTRVAGGSLALALALACSSASWAQTDEATEVEAVVVTARRVGVPVWRITQGRSTLVLVADADVPPGGIWRPKEMEKAIAGAGSMLVATVQLEGSPEEHSRWRERERIGWAPAFSPEMESRLSRLAAAGKVRRYRTQSLARTAEQLIDASLGARRRTEDGRSIAVRAAKKHKVKRGIFRDFPIAGLQETVEDTKARAGACLEAAVSLAEQPGSDAEERASAWRRTDVPALLGSRLEAARRACSRSGAPRRKLLIYVEDALRGALREPGVTVAVLPLWALADPSGLLDQLDRDFVIDGPDWKLDGP